MNRKMIRNLGALVLSVAFLSTCVYASTSTDDYGAAGAKTGDDYSLEEMLEYAIEDEYLAKAEYEALIEEFGVDKPFTNIIKAEQKHIEAVEGLYESYGFDLPTVDPSDYLAIPETLEETFDIGITAEIENIAMYESFLESDLPEDVRLVFEMLKKGSESHLQAFTRNASDDPLQSGNNGSQGQGNQSQGNGNQGQGNNQGNQSQGNGNQGKGNGQGNGRQGVGNQSQGNGNR